MAQGGKFSMQEFIEFLSSESESDSEEEEHLSGNIDVDSEDFDDNVEEELESTESNNNENNNNCNITNNDNTREKGDNNNATTRKAEAKKRETLAQIHQLRTHIVSLEKEKKSLLQGRTRQPDGRVYVELIDVELKCNENRKKEKCDIQQNLTKISSKIDKFKRAKEDVRKCPSNVEKLKELMEDVEENVMQFKDRQRAIYEELMLEEKTLYCDLQSFEKKMLSWQQVVDVPMVTKQVRYEGKKDALVPKEVTEFEKYLVATGGHQGGWDDIDHQAFIKFQKKHKDDKLVCVCLDNIPTQSKEDIEQHIEWFEEYLLLRERKREAIKLWKNMKQNEREDAVRKVDLDDDTEEKKRRKREELMERERELRFNRLKEHKEAELALEERERKIKLQSDKHKQERERMKMMADEKKRQESKAQVEEYRLKKMEEEEILKIAQRAKALQQKPLVSEEDKLRISERNEKLSQTKQKARLKDEEERYEKEKRLNKLKQQVHVEGDRDPERLFKLTAGWKHRKEEQEKSKVSSTITTGARLMPHRAVPSWRRGANT